MQTPTILIVGDGCDICEVISALLQSEGFFTLQAYNGQETLSLLGGNIDLIILDITIPGDSDSAICGKIRRFTTAPILYLNAKGLIPDKKAAFDSGDDNYLTKPFTPAGLLARVKAVLRRYQIYRGKNYSLNLNRDFIQIDSLAVHPISGGVFLNGTPILLRHKEYQLLSFLSQDQGTIFSVQGLYERLWGGPYLPFTNNTVMVYTRSLRQKVEVDPQRPKYILIVWGGGYQIV